jgi:hypothetical protein
MSKAKMRERQAAMSFTEKIKILEKLRDRDRAIAASGLREKAEQNARGRAAIEENLSRIPKSR